MSGEGRPALELPTGTDLRVAIAYGRWHAEISDQLLTRALAVAEQAGVRSPTLVPVSGSMELPVVVQQLATDHDAVVALGVVIRGGTPHFEYVCDAVTYGLTRVSLDTGVAIGNGVLTVDTVAQALARAGGPDATEDKGGEAMAAALMTATTLKKLRAPSSKMGF